jgi:hypothetical protein
MFLAAFSINQLLTQSGKNPTAKKTTDAIGAVT